MLLVRTQCIMVIGSLFAMTRITGHISEIGMVMHQVVLHQESTSHSISITSLEPNAIFNMAWFPKKQSNPITNLVGELNGCLGGIYFTTSIVPQAGVCLYTLNLTNLGLAQHKYGYIAIDGAITYEAMLNYLQGVLVGYRAAKMKK